MTLLGRYPDLIPTTREFTPPYYPAANTYSINNRITRQLFVSRVCSGTLTLNYENISHNQAFMFLDSYESCYGSIYSFTLPESTYTGLVSIKPYIDNSNTLLSWRWSSPPSIRSVIDSKCSVTANLKSSIILT